jgi:hypothetical protein
VNYELSYRPEVVDDLAKACDWYSSQDPGLDDRFLEEYFAALRFIRHSAEVPRKVFEDFRRVLMKRFPFAVWYQAQPGRAVILLIFDCRQNPERLDRLLHSR